MPHVAQHGGRQLRPACLYRYKLQTRAVCVWLQVGMGATLLDGVVMEPGSIVAAGAVVSAGVQEMPVRSQCNC